MSVVALQPEPVYDVAALDDPAPLIAMMRRVNAELDEPERGGFVWWLIPKMEESEDHLLAGVRGERGCLVWSEPHAMFHPAEGLNERSVDYFTWDGHHFVQKPGAEVPIERVYEVVEEFTRTRRRPECVQWTPVTLGQRQA